MAYASVASLLQTIDLVNYHGDSSISSRFKGQLTFLQEHATALQSFLEDGDPNRAKNWEDTIRDVTDRAEEIIDLLVSESLLKSSSGSNSEIDYSMDELEKVTEEMESTVDRVKGGRSIINKTGPDKEVMKIVSLLCEGSSNLETISIVGMGGMGKSALARNAYDHPLVMEHFDVRALSMVSRDYNPRGIIWRLPWEDMKIVAALPNLEVLKLRNHACFGGTWETSEGGFSRLEYLLIDGSFLEHWITKSSHFPRLKRLVLLSCYRLSEVPHEIGKIPTLELMKLDRTNRGLLDSAMQLREDRRSLGDDLLRVHVLA